MKRSIMIAMATTLALASCQTDDIMDNHPGSTQNANNAIRFDGEAGKMSRASDNSAATALNNNFVVYGTKTVPTDEKQSTTSVVYNYYNVNYTAKDSQNENDKAWIYDKQGTNKLNTTGSSQSIKYWDFSASEYDFVAFSYGKATHDTENSEVTATFTNKTDSKALDYYTLEGTVNALSKCYVADKIVAKKSDNNSKANNTLGGTISLTFRTITSKVTLGIYETIDGYSVKNVKFYSNSEDQNPDEKVKLITTQNVSVPIGDDKAQVKITFDDNNKAQFEWSKVDDSSTKQYIELGALKNKTTQARTRTNPSDFVIGKDDKKNASLTDECSVKPATLGDLTLKVDYTLESDDNSGEEIHVKGAHVKISSSDLTTWNENTSYKYIFKISKDTNGNTGGTTNPAGLYPITFDAVVTEPANGTDHEEEIKDASTDPNNAGE